MFTKLGRTVQDFEPLQISCSWCGIETVQDFEPLPLTMVTSQRNRSYGPSLFHGIGVQDSDPLVCFMA